MGNLLINWLRKIRKNHFVQAVAILGSGSLIAQIVALAASPILSRIYEPSDFGLLAVFAAMVASITPAICGKFEVAIVIAKSKNAGRQLLGISLQVAFVISLLLMISTFVFEEQIIQLFKAEALRNWIYLVPPMMFLTGIVSAFNFYSNRMNEFGMISNSKILIAISSMMVSILLGIAGLHYGLLLASFLATTSAAIWLLYKYRYLLTRRNLGWNQRKQVLINRYRDFPLYNASTGLLNGVTLSLPVLFLSRYFPDEAVGYYALMIRVVQAPLGIISGAVSQVNLNKVSNLVNRGLNARPYLIRITLISIGLVLPFCLVIFFFAPQLFAWVFGEQWRVAGQYLHVLIPAISLRFVVSMLSTTFGATHNNQLGAVWKILSFVTTFAVFLYYAPRLEVFEMMVVFLVKDLVLYSLYYVMIWYAAGHPRSS